MTNFKFARQTMCAMLLVCSCGYHISASALDIRCYSLMPEDFVDFSCFSEGPIPFVLPSPEPIWVSPPPPSVAP